MKTKGNNVWYHTSGQAPSSHAGQGKYPHRRNYL